MRSVSIVLALAMVLSATLTFVPSEARALEPPKLSITVEAGTEGLLRFTPATIVVPSVPIILNVTLFNNDTTDTEHTFSIRESGVTAPRVDLAVAHPGNRTSIEFAVNSTNQIYFGGQLFRAEASSAGGIKFFCRPHEPAGMVGNIVVGGVTPPTSPELGIFLRAYWIGIIGLVA